MSDLPIEELGGKTPLEYANTSNMDFIAQNGQIGLAATIPDTFPPGSDVANMSILGYDPKKYYTGRAPLEVVNMGIELGRGDVAFRLNFVTLSASVKNADSKMDDFSSGHISSDESALLIKSLEGEIGGDVFSFYSGVSYRNIMICHDIAIEEELLKLKCTPPHDISGRSVADYLPRGDIGKKIIKITLQAEKILAEHPVNLARRAEGKKEANSIWLWGQGSAPSMPLFRDIFGLEGGIISAVDLINGLGKAIGLKSVRVEGATGYIDTNYSGKVDAALEILEERDFVFLHVEAPDEAGHNGSLKDKLKAIEDFDEKIVGPVLKVARERKNLHILVLCDHATPVSLKTHTDAPVPFVLYPSVEANMTSKGYSEKNAFFTANNAMPGCMLMNYFLK